MTAATPAIAGAAQVVQRPGDWSDPAEAKGPIELMEAAARAAAEDAGVPGLLARVGWVGVAGGRWRHANPGQVLAARLGCPDAATALTTPSGSSPGELVGIAADRVARGDVEVALVLGGEANWSRQAITRAGGEPQWCADPGEGEPERYAAMPPEMLTEAATVGAPANFYAVFEDSLRVALGRTVAEHRDRISELWEAFSRVAAANPYAWDRRAHTAAEIREPSSSNRMIAFPYTKAMVANNTVDMASAVLLCSTDAAAAAGVDRDRLVFPYAVASSHETWQVLNRDLLHGVPAVAAAGRAALDHAGIGVDDLDHVDLYACFPSMVQMSAAALGFDLSRPLTVTGGLGFAGAPLANSSGQALAAMVPLLREGGYGFVHANGGFATKHAFGVYANRPPQRPYARIDGEDLVDHRPRPALPDDWEGKATVEAATVAFDRDGPTHAIAAVRNADGARAWARSQDPDVIAAAMIDGLAGATVDRTDAGTFDA